MKNNITVLGNENLTAPCAQTPAPIPLPYANLHVRVLLCRLSFNLSSNIRDRLMMCSEDVASVVNFFTFYIELTVSFRLFHSIHTHTQV